jgi:hypothetical protein
MKLFETSLGPCVSYPRGRNSSENNYCDWIYKVALKYQLRVPSQCGIFHGKGAAYYSASTEITSNQIVLEVCITEGQPPCGRYQRHGKKKREVLDAHDICRNVIATP